MPARRPAAPHSFKSIMLPPSTLPSPSPLSNAHAHANDRPRHCAASGAPLVAADRDHACVVSYAGGSNRVAGGKLPPPTPPHLPTHPKLPSIRKKLTDSDNGEARKARHGALGDRVGANHDCTVTITSRVLLHTTYFYLLSQGNSIFFRILFFGFRV
jgi:hypothetical protein